MASELKLLLLSIKIIFVYFYLILYNNSQKGGCMDLTRPEGVTLEYKELMPSADALARLMVAFSNAKGGVVVVGIKDKNRQPVGADFRQDMEEFVANVATNNCTPVITPEVEYETVDRKSILLIHIPPGRRTPYYVKKLGKTQGTLVRIGSTIRVADDRMVAELERRSHNLSYDRTPCINSNLSHLDNAALEKYFELRNKKLGAPVEIINELTLTKAHIFHKTNRKPHPSLASLLVFGRDPQQQTGLINAAIKAARFRGSDKQMIIDQMVIEGRLPDQIDQAVKFVLRNIPVSGYIEGARRIDKPAYPMEAVREIITNAVVHRDYTRADADPILMAIYDQRMEIESPGILPLGVSLDNIREVQKNRNPLIARILFEMGYFEAWGRGIDSVYFALEEAGLPPPEFIETDISFRVVLRCGEVLPKRFSTFEERKEDLLTYLKEKRNISNKQYAERYDLPHKSAYYDLRKMTAAGLLVKKGGGRGTYYQLAEQGH